MKKFKSYSTLAEVLTENISKDFNKYKKLSGLPVESIDEFVGIELSNTTGTKRRLIRAILKIFGIIISGGKIETIITSKQIMRLVLSQLKPVLKYISKSLLLALIKKINTKKSVNSNNPETTTEFVVEMAQNGVLTDFVLSNITDGQYALATKNVSKTEVIDEFKCGDEEPTNKEAALKEEVQRLRRQLDRRNVNSGTNELFIERIENSIISVAPSLGFINEHWNGDKTFNHAESATEVLHISDWHIGEVDNIGGLNQFNYNIACDRVKTLTNKVISWTKMHRSMYKVDELVIIATGDMISGDIHDELRATNEFPAPEQCVKASMLISKMINELSSVFKKVRIEYIVADNHSRTTKKMEFAPGTNSYNYIVGTMSKILLRDNSVVEFNVYPEIERIISVEGMKYLITHGNSIRGGQLGLPYYGMTRRLGSEALIRMNMPEDTHFNKIVMGHYHTPLMTNGIEMTGCLSSTTAFDHASGRHSRACQTAWLVSKKFEMDYSVFWLS